MELLQDLQANGELSPTAFSLSVHNAIAGLFSMIYVNQLETSVIAPGRDGLASGFVEALGLLQEGHPAVLLVFYDEPVPAFFPTAPYQTRLDQPCALALKLASNGAGLPLRMTRLQAAADDREQPLQIPAFLAFLADPGQTQLQLGPWQWQKP